MKKLLLALAILVGGASVAKGQLPAGHSAAQCTNPNCFVHQSNAFGARLMGSGGGLSEADLKALREEDARNRALIDAQTTATITVEAWVPYPTGELALRAKAISGGWAVLLDKKGEPQTPSTKQVEELEKAFAKVQDAPELPLEYRASLKKLGLEVTRPLETADSQVSAKKIIVELEKPRAGEPKYYQIVQTKRARQIVVPKSDPRYAGLNGTKSRSS